MHEGQVASILLFAGVWYWNVPQILIQTSVPVVQKLAGQVKEVLSTHAKETEDGTGAGTGPTTTVFVGNISEKASDMLVRQLLAVS